MIYEYFSFFFLITLATFASILVTGVFLCAFFFNSFGPDMLLSKMLAESGGDKPKQLYLLKQKSHFIAFL